MTSEEAIMHLQNIKIYSFQDGYTDEAREALEMAMKALERDSCKDYINRQAAIENAKAIYESNSISKTYDVIKMLTEMR